MTASPSTGMRIYDTQRTASTSPSPSRYAFKKAADNAPRLVRDAVPTLTGCRISEAPELTGTAWTSRIRCAFSLKKRKVAGSSRIFRARPIPDFLLDMLHLFTPSGEEIQRQAVALETQAGV